MLNRATTDPLVLSTYQLGVYLAPSPHRRQRRVQKPLLRPAAGLSPLAVVTTPGQLSVRSLYVHPAQRLRSEMPRRAGHSRLHAPRLVRVRIWPP